MKERIIVLFLLLTISNFYYSQVGLLTDSRDGKLYKIIEIGTQTWIAENLNVTASFSKL